MLSADYVVGLTDGEGSFTIYPRPPGGSRVAEVSKWNAIII